MVMSSSSIKTYIKYVYSIIPWYIKLIIISAIIFLPTLFYQFNKNPNSPEAFKFIATLFFIIFFINITSWIVVGIIKHYVFFKKTIYSKTKLPEKIEEIESITTKDFGVYLIELDKRLKNLENNLSPLRISIYAIFVGVSIAVALLIISPLLPKILFPK